jgi:HEAT repeat protein/flagellar basal body rod protein FlgF
MSMGTRYFTGKRLFFLLGGCCFMMSCQPQLRGSMSQYAPGDSNQERRTTDSTARVAPSLDGQMPADWGVRAMTESKRVDARTARLAVSRVMNSEGRLLLRVDSALFGGADWAKALFENVGLSARQEGDVLLVEARGGGNLRDALRRSLKPIHQAMDRARGNLRKAEIIAARGAIGGLECSFESGVAVVAFRGDGERIDDSQGPIKKTDRALDVAIRGRGMFVVQSSVDGEVCDLYTRNGRLAVDAEGRLRVDGAGGMLIAGDIRVPADAEELTIGKDGAVTARRRGERARLNIGTLRLVAFEQPGCLEETKPGFYVWTPAAGLKIEARPGEDGVGVVEQGVLEDSNVDVAESWAWLSLLEDARQLVLAMAEEMDAHETSVSDRLAEDCGTPRLQGCEQTIVIRMPDFVCDGRSPMLAKLLRIRGVDHWSSPGGVEVARSRAAATALVDYLGMLRTRLDVIAENISGTHGPVPGETRSTPYTRKIVRLSDAGKLEIVEDTAPFGVRWEIVPNLSTGFAMPMLIESTNVSMETELEDSDRTTREYRAVREALADMERDAVPALAAELASEQATARIDACYVLGEIGSGAIGAVPALMKALADSDRSIRNAAIAALMRVAPESPQVVAGMLESLSTSLESADWRERREAVEALRRLGPRATPCVPQLIRLLDDPTSGAALALAEIGPGAQQAVQPLAAALSDPDAHVRMHAAYALRRLGVVARDALPALLAAMHDADKDVRMQALAAVGQIGGGESGCLAALATVLSNEDDDVRRRVSAALGPLGTWARALDRERPAIDSTRQRRVARGMLELTGIVAPPAADFAEVAIVASTDAEAWKPLFYVTIAHAGWDQACDVKALIELASDEDERLSAAAINALGALGGQAAAAVPALAAAMDHNSPWIRRAAAEALGRIGAGAAAAVPSLEAHLINESEQVAAAAAIALGRIGAAAKEATDTLHVLSRHSSPAVRSAALTALDSVAAAHGDAKQPASGVSRRIAVSGEHDGAY